MDGVKWRRRWFFLMEVGQNCILVINTLVLIFAMDSIVEIVIMVASPLHLPNEVSLIALQILIPSG